MLEFLERLIPLLVALLTAIAPVIVAIISSGKKSRKQQQEESEKLHVSMAGMKESLDRMSDRMEKMEGHSREDYKNILQMQIMAEEMPLEVRLEAGEKYVSEGWNGAIKAKYELLKKQYMEREVQENG